MNLDDLTPEVDPAHWERRRLRSLIASATNGAWGSEPGNGEPARCIRATDFDRVRLRVAPEGGVERGFTPYELMNNRLRPGDILLEKSGGGDKQPVGKAVLFDSQDVAVGSNFLGRLRPAPDVDASFLVLLFESLYANRRNTRHIKQSTGIQNLDAFSYFNEIVSVPPSLEEQRAIVRFLDQETARIDALIANKDKMIERLEEHRRAFITTTVSVGLENTEYEATDSQFAPSIPKSWRLMRLCHVVERIVDTEHATAPVAEGGHYLVVRTSNVREGELRFEGARYTDEESFKRWTRRGLPMPGDVLFTREAPTGEACVVPSDVDLCIGQRMVLLKVNRRLTSGQWIVHSIESGPAQAFIDLLSRSTTVAHLNMRDIPNIPIVLPPIDVQSDLLDAIADEVSRVQSAKRCLAEQVQILKEHRRALITAAVTGQIDVGSAA